MGVSIKAGALVHSLTSPPDHPTPYPATKLIAEAKQYTDRTILVTVPFPDTIELTADILNEHFQQPYETGGAKWIAQQIDQDLNVFLDGLQKSETEVKPKPKVTSGAKRNAIFQLLYDPEQPLHRAQLTLWRTPPKPEIAFGTWQVKLEFSASKAGPGGLVKLIALTEDALPFSFSALLADFRVLRLDSAIDLIGAYPLDLIAHIKRPGKRMIYVGDDGHPESVYLYEAKAPLKKPPPHLKHKTTGTLRLKLYERRDYMKQLALKPPYGSCPVTRVETELRWPKKQQRPELSKLDKLAKNPFEGKRVAYAAKLGAGLSQPAEWIAFCLAAFGGGVATAQRRWRLGAGLKYRKLYTKCAGDLIDQSQWPGWKAGLDYTGLSKWISIAASAPNAGKKKLW